VAAGDIEYAAGGEAAFLARQSAHQRGDLAEPAERDLRQHEGDVLLRHLCEE
jgi:hypothetical protein